MVDNLTVEKRSAVMAAVRSVDTKPEMIVRRLLHGMGYRFRLHQRDLPGKPDVVLSKYRKVIFVHGCFWHGHSGCPHLRIPATNTRYWKNKISGNATRDRAHLKELRRLGWSTLVVWECSTASKQILQRELRAFLREAKTR